MFVKIPDTLDQNKYDEFRAQWSDKDEICVFFAKINNLNKFRNLVEFILIQNDEDFKMALLSDLIEQEICTIDLLKRVFVLNDVGNCVSICLRNDLDEELTVMCKNSNFAEVQEHLKHKS